MAFALDTIMLTKQLVTWYLEPGLKICSEGPTMILESVVTRSLAADNYRLGNNRPGRPLNSLGTLFR